ARPPMPRRAAICMTALVLTMEGSTAQAADPPRAPPRQTPPAPSRPADLDPGFEEVRTPPPAPVPLVSDEVPGPTVPASKKEKQSLHKAKGDHRQIPGRRATI